MFRQHPRPLLVGTMLSLATFVLFYLATVFVSGSTIITIIGLLAIPETRDGSLSGARLCQGSGPAPATHGIMRALSRQR